MKIKPITLSNAMTNEELDNAIRHNDALEAIQDGVSKTDYVLMHKPYAQPLYATAYDSATGNAMTQADQTREAMDGRR